MGGLRYRLALDLGSTSLGWAIVRLKGDEPVAFVKVGVRIFGDGRNPKDGSSLAVTRRAARAMRRHRDRLLKRKHRMMALLLKHGFFPADVAERKALELLNPYELRAKGLNEALAPAEFARALFHINQRRGFKSNRKTDKQDNDSGALKTAINTLRKAIATYPVGSDGKPLQPGNFNLLDWVNRQLPETRNDLPRTVGELLWRHIKPEKKGQPIRAGLVRARYRERHIEKEDGKTRIDKSYDLYIDRAMIETEFDALWAKQAEINPTVFTEAARAELKDCLLHQRPLKPVKPGRCTLEPDKERAPLALPSQQRFRIYQEVNNLRILREDLRDEPLTLEQRDQIVALLERPQRDKKTAHEVSFDQMRTALSLRGATKFNLEDAKRTSLKGNSTSSNLSKKNLFGPDWFNWSLARQDEIVMRLLTEESEAALVAWLQNEFGVDEAHAEGVANARLADGYGSLSAKALAKILPKLKTEVISAKEAEIKAGYKFAERTGEILSELPYYGEPESMQRHVGFGTMNHDDVPEKRYGKIANPTVHIGLNQVRVVVNALIKHYGHPSEVIIELARDLKQSREQRKEDQERQAQNQKRNERLRADTATILQIAPERVKHADIQKLILWEELSFDVAERRCPYSGVQIGARMALSDEVEIEHILPFSQTLDDSLNNKTLATRRANRVKGDRTPAQAREDFEREGWSYENILQRAERMPKNKRYRFGPDGYEKWLGEEKGFLARALNDTRHLSRVAREYLSLICPQGMRVIPGRMTAMLRAKFGLNDILGLQGEKNRNDHRHHAVDACVIAVTDQGLLQRFAQASASAREKQLDKLVDSMPLPWPTYYDHVKRAVHNIWISHKPDHGYEAGFADETTYRPPHLDPQGKWRTRGVGGSNPNERSADTAMIAISEPKLAGRHKLGLTGEVLPYKGYLGGDNYCLEITLTENGAWEGNVIPTFSAYEIVRQHGIRQLRNKSGGQNGASLVMRLVAGDCIAIEKDSQRLILRVVKMRAGRNQVTLVGVSEANHANRLKEKDSSLIWLEDKSASSLRSLRARHITISPIGELRDPGFKE
ncbi:MAG: type II CRISPR RNA-guided endonuclease Cas9 [Betaproteobacteria bacterium HGW-Betaproteobacteria-11]|nr:MAG: type II CRISPR RNA-guided endonuclease Cas9 [Betaproteobacteria bacterium HGW-Betaproteobacteria-11]